MPKIVHHEERKELIAAALARVAAQAGVTAGMVQHYFPSKDSIMEFAMESSSVRFGDRMQVAISELGAEPDPQSLVRVILLSLLPDSESSLSDARVALTFLSYAATRPAAARRLSESNNQLRGYLGQILRSAVDSGAMVGDINPDETATGLLALADGLGIHVLSSAFDAAAAQAALDAQLNSVFGDSCQP